MKPSFALLAAADRSKPKNPKESSRLRLEAETLTGSAVQDVQSDVRGAAGAFLRRRVELGERRFPALPVPHRHGFRAG